jgi:prepilin-type N-terminal cleavage/methylation domain-containing protein
MGGTRMIMGHRTRGFTIAEVVCVLVIMTIIAAIALPRYAKALCRHRAELAARRVVADLALVQRVARFSSGPQKVTFDTVAETYVMPGVPDPDHAGVDYLVPLDEDPYRVDLVSAELGGDAEIAFDGFGQPDSGGSIIVSAGNCYKRIDVDSATGDAAVTGDAAPPEVEALPVEIK